MPQFKIQPSFNSGEWAPQLYARVDLEKYRSAAALLRNFFVDYRGGASTRPGTKYCLQAYKSATAVRLIPFQGSFTVGYMLEFGHQYIRFYYQGSPVLETGLNITGATQANPCVLSVTNSYTTGDVDWVYISGVSGMTQLNGRYYKVHSRTAGTVTLYDLFGNPVDSTSFGAWTSGGTTQRVYTISSPYGSTDLAQIKFAQNINELILCHPDYVPQALTIVSATNWLLSPISFATTITPPTGLFAASSLSPGSVNYSYIVTSVDANGSESEPSTAVTLSNKQDIRTVSGTNTITWSPVTGAASYNVYKSDVSISNPVPVGVPYGFIGNVSGTSIADSNISADFSNGPPVTRNPFAPGAYVSATTITNPGSYTTKPTLTFAAAPFGGTTAVGSAVMYALTIAVQAAGSGYAASDTLTFANNITAVVDTVGGTGDITGVSITNVGAITGALPANPVSPTATSGSGTSATFNFTYGVLAISISVSGSGYVAAPAITFSAGAATATSTLGPTNAGNPAVPCFFQQRLALAAPAQATQTIYFSQPGAYFNYNVSNPIAPDDAITAPLVSGSLSNIKNMVAQSGGLIVFSDGGSYLINGGSQGAAITPTTIVANAQSFDGSNDLPPIVANFDVLYVSAKGSSVRDSTYNFYANVFTGVDISVLASHLFFGYTLEQWCWAQEPYKVVWAVRNDGTMLTLTFVKDQEFIGWAHSDTLGTFESVATIVEPYGSGNVNAVYTVVQRTVAGQSLQYVERFAERYWTAADECWCVDSGLSYSGAPATSFTGGEHLAGLTVTGLADGSVITPFVMPASGSFTLPTAASEVVVGLGFTAQLQTMAIDEGSAGVPTIQGRPKKIAAVDVRVADTLGLKIGGSFSSDSLVTMKDLVVGNVGSMLIGQDSQLVTDLFTGDARTYVDPRWTVYGQFCIQQDLPLPATILGVLPIFEAGDTKK